MIRNLMTDLSKSSNVNFVLLSIQQIEEIIRSTVEQTTIKLMNEYTHSNNTTYLSIKQVCEKLSINPSTLYRWTKEGLIPVHKIGGRRLYLLDEIKSFISSNDDY